MRTALRKPDCYCPGREPDQGRLPTRARFGGHPVRRLSGPAGRDLPGPARTCRSTKVDSALRALLLFSFVCFFSFCALPAVLPRRTACAVCCCCLFAPSAAAAAPPAVQSLRPSVWESKTAKKAPAADRPPRLIQAGALAPLPWVRGSRVTRCSHCSRCRPAGKGQWPVRGRKRTGVVLGAARSASTASLTAHTGVPISFRRRDEGISGGRGAPFG